jgi:hypothetical protein
MWSPSSSTAFAIAVFTVGMPPPNKGGSGARSTNELNLKNIGQKFLQQCAWFYVPLDELSRSLSLPQK